MNRLNRIAAILIQLQSKKVVKGQEIADRFSISLRTAYRDIKTLEEAGVPIVSEAGTGYSIMEGYRLPPIMFTREEAQAFLTAEKLVEKFTDASTFAIYQSALYKIKSVLKSDEKEHLDNMYNHIEVLKNPYLPENKTSQNHIQIVLNSVSKKVVVLIDYLANHNQQKTKRQVEPLGITYITNAWYLMAFCLLRKDYRTFRLDRIEKIVQTNTAFQTQHPPLKTYLKVITQENRTLHKVVMLIDKSAIQYIGEQKFYHGFISEKEVKNKIEMTFLCPSIEGFARWFMMLGDHAEIVSPPNLKRRIKELATVIYNKTK